MRIETATKYTRQNTGSHFLDSGGAYGRIYNSPVMSERTSWDRWGAPTISVTHMLAEFAEVHPMHSQFYKWDRAQDKNLPWFEAGDAFMRSRGYTCAARDNTCNQDHDLDQNIVWEVWVPEWDDASDWYFSDTAIVALYLHTGCDVRGGYASPLFVTFTGEAALPYTFQAWFYSSDLPEWLNEEIGYGYSDYPLGELEKAGYEWVGDFQGNEATFKHNETGHTARVNIDFDVY